MKDTNKSSSQKLEKIPIAKIIADAGTQCRAGLNPETVSDYAEALKDSAKFPPLIAFTDGKVYWLADGFHRLAATERNGEKFALCDVRKGSRLDAVKFALGANENHGLRRTNADKRRAVEIALAEWPDVADAELARWCAVSQPFVSGVRRELQPITVIGSPRIGHDGKIRQLPPTHPKGAFNLRERFDQLPGDDQLVVGAALCIFDRQGRSVSQEDICNLINHLQRQARN
jgi:uncharacterized ParB-like nuclease family protein